MSDDTRPTEDLANTQPASVDDLLDIAETIDTHLVDALFDDRDHNPDALHRVKRGSQLAICGAIDDWDFDVVGAGSPSPPVVCALCETLYAMRRQLDLTGLDEMPPRQ